MPPKWHGYWKPCPHNDGSRTRAAEVGHGVFDQCDLAVAIAVSK